MGATSGLGNGTRFDLTGGVGGGDFNHASRTKESRRSGSGLVYYVLIRPVVRLRRNEATEHAR